MLVKVKVHHISNVQNRINKIKETVNSLLKEVETLKCECLDVNIELTDDYECRETAIEE